MMLFHAQFRAWQNPRPGQRWESLCQVVLQVFPTACQRACPGKPQSLQESWRQACGHMVHGSFQEVAVQTSGAHQAAAPGQATGPGLH